jgi:hypothetical protein
VSLWSNKNAPNPAIAHAFLLGPAPLSIAGQCTATPQKIARKWHQIRAFLPIRANLNANTPIS